MPPFFRDELFGLLVSPGCLPPLALKFIDYGGLSSIALGQDLRVMFVELIQRRLVRLVAATRVDCRLEQLLASVRILVDLDVAPLSLKTVFDVFATLGLFLEAFEDWPVEFLLIIFQAGQVSEPGNFLCFQRLLSKQCLFLSLIEAGHFAAL